MTERSRVQGVGASPGFAVGRAAIMPSCERHPLHNSDARAGTEALTDAVAAALGSLQHLAQRSLPDSQAVLSFQIDMMLDPALLEMATDRMTNGNDAVFAWIAAMDNYIAGFQQSDDEGIRARAVDVIDIRNRVLDVMMNVPAKSFPPGSIYVGGDIEPSFFLTHDWTAGGGILLFDGSAVSHVAMLARARSIPMVVGVGAVELSSGQSLLVDGNTGIAIVDPLEADLPTVTAEPTRKGPSGIVASPTDGGRIETADGRAVTLSINVNDLHELDAVDPATTVGIGLLRTELLLPTPADIFNEDEQYAAYCRILQWAGDRPVTIRLFDFGGDKTLPALTGQHGSFLGLRGIRLLLQKPEILRVQVRALLRAARTGHLRIMMPMVTIAAEFEAARQIISSEAAALSRSGQPHAVPPLGMMVEVPAAALTLDTFAGADFFSFGTNDLGQYLAAAARDNPAVAGLHDASRAAIYRLLKIAMLDAAAMNRPVSLCGDMAGDPACVADLLACGLRHFSVAPSHLQAVKASIMATRAGGQQAMAD